VGLAKAWRGLKRDMRVLLWLTKRPALITTYVRSQGVRKLQLGTSNNLLEGWLNTDITPNHSSVVYLDATRRFLFDQETLHHALQNAGFLGINFYKPGVSDDPNLRNLEFHGQELQCEDINQFQTIVVEGRKK
jgi:hypothetical protein